jgi:hypothetical protein
MARVDRERRESPRSETLFVAVEQEGQDIYYRLVTDVSATGFSFEEPAVPRRIGDPVVMEFPLPGGQPFKIRGEVRRERTSEQRVGVRFTETSFQLERLIAELPRR